MNASTKNHPEGKPFKCGISDTSQHLQFWSELLEEIQKWKLWEYKKDKDSDTFTWKDIIIILF